MNRSPVSRQAAPTRNCGESGKASLARSARRENGGFVRIPRHPSWLDDLDPDESIKTLHSSGDADGGRPDAGGQFAAADFVASQQCGSVAGPAPLARRPHPG